MKNARREKQSIEASDRMHRAAEEKRTLARLKRTKRYTLVSCTFAVDRFNGPVSWEDVRKDLLWHYRETCRLSVAFNPTVQTAVVEDETGAEKTFKFRWVERTLVNANHRTTRWDHVEAT